MHSEPRKIDSFDPARVVWPSGLANVGAICWLTSVLQALASCTSLRDIALRLRAGPQDKRLTAVGRELVNMLVAQTLPHNSAVRMAAALQEALAGRDSNPAELGASAIGNQDAHEGFVLLLEAAWDESAGVCQIPGGNAHRPVDRPGLPVPERTGARTTTDEVGSMNPFLQPFALRRRATLYDANGELIGEATEELGTYVDLFHLDAPGARDPLAPKADGGLYDDDDDAGRARGFAGTVRRCVTALEDCPPLADGRAPAFRMYQLALAPEILVVAFNCFGVTGRGGAAPRRPHWFPERFKFAQRNGAPAVQYRLVAQIEHSGNMGGGHYWGRFLRRGEDLETGEPQLNEPHVIDDANNRGIQAFLPSAATYLLFYQWE